ncbi:MAG: efflux RND transporter periplasmic adaptor subunit [Treponema sp.]|jgi:RND family efflux transporter MFP subunit|nr:efflux RND transporter periplasmic adaptor subunit [Treponema sp.]
MKIKKILLIQMTMLLCFSCGKPVSAGDIDVKNVRGAAAATRELPDEVSGFGSLSFISRVDITSPHDGVISKLYFREGDFIKHGAVALLIDNPQIKLSVERAENNYSQALAACDLAGSKLLEGTFQAEAQLLALDKAEAELALARRKWEEDKRKHQHQETLYEAGGIHTEAILAGRFAIDTEWEQILLMKRELEIRKIGCRTQDLVKAGIAIPADENECQNALVSLMTSSLRAELEAARARLDAAEKELSSANIAFAELTVKSPASGIVGARYLEEGERVRFQDKIFSLMDTSSLYAFFPVREKDALRIEKGMKANVLIDGTGEYREGLVDLVYPQADSQSLSFLIRVLLHDSTNGETTEKLKPGMFARVTVIIGPPKHIICIPESAIFNQKNNEGSVFIINGSVLTERKIVLGAVHGEDREITAGLNIKEMVVLRPDSNLREGSHVSLVD